MTERPVLNVAGTSVGINLMQSSGAYTSHRSPFGSHGGVLIRPLGANSTVLMSSKSSSQEPSTAQSGPTSSYSYKVKVYDASSKRKFYVRELHITEKFTSVEQLKATISSELDLCSFLNIGYFEGRSHNKRWLVTDQDLEMMYKKVSCGEISLWCEEDDQGNEPSTCTKKKKTQSEEKLTKRQQKEEQFEDMFLKLKERHGELLTGPQYRLWARMLVSGTYDDWDNPPPVPMIMGNTPKRPKQESLAEALAGAATAVVKVLSGSQSTTPKAPSNTSAGSVSIGMSPSKAADLRMKHLEQLRYMQSLQEDQIITNEEFLEQKKTVLDTLRKIT